MRLLDICRELGIAVPEEMAILGVGNDPVICETLRPTLSSIDLDARRIGYEAARLLDRKMAGEQANESILIPPSHIAVRQSTDLMVIDDADVVQAMRFIREFACAGIDVALVADKVGLSQQRSGTAFSQISRAQSQVRDHADSDRACQKAFGPNGNELRDRRQEMRFQFARVFQFRVPPGSRHDSERLSPHGSIFQVIKPGARASRPPLCDRDSHTPNTRFHTEHA